MKKTPGGPKANLSADDKFRSRYDWHVTAVRARCGHMTHVLAKTSRKCMECHLADERLAQRAPKRG